MLYSKDIGDGQVLAVELGEMGFFRIVSRYNGKTAELASNRRFPTAYAAEAALREDLARIGIVV